MCTIIFNQVLTEPVYLKVETIEGRKESNEYGLIIRRAAKTICRVIVEPGHHLMKLHLTFVSGHFLLFFTWQG